FVQQHGRLAGALPAPDHGDAAAAEVREVGVLAGMTDEPLRQADELCRPEVLVLEPEPDDHAPRLDHVAALEAQLESAAGGGDPRDLAPIEIRHRVLLEPFAIG